MIDFLKIAYRLRCLKDLKIGLIAPSLTLYPLPKSPPHMEARIDARHWDVEIGLSPAFEPEKDEKLARYMALRHIEGIESVLITLLYHEGFHWLDRLGCPMDLETHEAILKAIQEALKEDKKEFYAPYLTNVFEDLVVNTSLKVYGRPLYGQPVFFYDQMLTGGPNRLYEAFVLLNLALWGERPEEDLLFPLMQKGPRVVDAVIDILVELDISGKTPRRKLMRLGPKKDWPMKAAFIAKRLADLIEPRKPLPALGPSGGCDEDPKKKRGGLIAWGIQGGDRADRPSVKDLDTFYRTLAKKIPVTVPKEGSGFEFPMVRYGFKPFDPQRHEPWRIKPRVILDPESPLGNGLNVQVPAHALTMPLAQARPSSLEADVCLVIDASGSMVRGDAGGVPWGVDSPYHYALLGLYGILESLGERLAAVRFQIVAFSFRTRASRWVGIEDLEPLKKIAFSPEGGGTRLYLRTLKEALGSSPNVVLLLSDGEIQNWSKIKRGFLETVSGHYFGVLALGEGEAIKDLEAQGFPVYPIQSGEDLTRLMIVLGTRKGQALNVISERLSTVAMKSTKCPE